MTQKSFLITKLMIANKKLIFNDSNKILLFLFILIIPALITGPLIPEILLILSILIFIYINFKKKKIKYFGNLYLNLFWFWCVYLIISSLQSDYVLLSLESSLFYFRFIFIILIISFLIDYYPNFRKYLLFILVFNLLILFIDSVYQYTFGENILGFKYNGKRLSSFFGDELVMGGFVVRFLPLLIALIFYINPKKINILIFSVLTVASILIILSGERTAIFLFIIFLMCFFLLIRNYFKLKIIFLLSSILIFIFILFNNILLKERIINHTYNQFSKIHTNNIVIFSKYHQYNLVLSKNIFLDNMFLGIGPKVYREKCKDYEIDNYCKICECSMHPHNYLSQLFSETGIFSAIIVMVFFFYYFFILAKVLYYRLLSKKYLNNYQICVCISVLINLFLFSPSGNLFNNWISIILYINISFGIYEFLLNTTKKQNINNVDL